MKYYKKLFSILFCLIYIFSITSSAESNTKNWYIVKRGNCEPGFPSEATFLSDHNCYYIDKSNSKKLYLTFDAGYENGNIEKILDIMKENDIKGAFFVLSNLVKKNTDLVKRMSEEGHLVCNHTSNHKNLTKLTKEEIKCNLERLENEYNTLTGMKMQKIFRYPEGQYNKDTVLTIEKLGYKTFFWSLAYADWDNNKQPSAEQAIKTLLSNTHDGAIILLHPTSKTNVEILPTLISKWKEMGYSFGTLDEI